jgi:hypothetical protein
VRRRVLGEEHPNTLTSAGDLVASLARQGRYVEAEKCSRSRSKRGGACLATPIAHHSEFGDRAVADARQAAD